MPVLPKAGFVDLRILAVVVNEPICLHYFVRRNPKTLEPDLFFIVRECDLKILRPFNSVLGGMNEKGDKSEQAIRIIINQVCKDEHVWATPQEIKALKYLQILSPRVPKCALISPSSLIRILRHFHDELRAIAFEAVLMSLLSDFSLLSSVMLNLKNAVYTENEKYNLPHSHEYTYQMLKNQPVSERHHMPLPDAEYPPPWQEFYGENAPVLDNAGAIELSYAFSIPKSDFSSKIWSPLISQPNYAPLSITDTPKIAQERVQMLMNRVVRQQDSSSMLQLRSVHKEHPQLVNKVKDEFDYPPFAPQTAQSQQFVQLLEASNGVTRQSLHQQAQVEERDPKIATSKMFVNFILHPSFDDSALSIASPSTALNSDQSTPNDSFSHQPQLHSASSVPSDHSPTFGDHSPSYEQSSPFEFYDSQQYFDMPNSYPSTIAASTTSYSAYSSANSSLADGAMSTHGSAYTDQIHHNSQHHPQQSQYGHPSDSSDHPSFNNSTPQPYTQESPPNLHELSTELMSTMSSHSHSRHFGGQNNHTQNIQHTTQSKHIPPLNTSSSSSNSTNIANLPPASLNSYHSDQSSQIRPPSLPKAHPHPSLAPSSSLSPSTEAPNPPTTSLPAPPSQSTALTVSSNQAAPDIFMTEAMMMPSKFPVDLDHQIPTLSYRRVIASVDPKAPVNTHFGPNMNDTDFPTTNNQNAQQIHVQSYITHEKNYTSILLTYREHYSNAIRRDESGSHSSKQTLPHKSPNPSNTHDGLAHHDHNNTTSQSQSQPQPQPPSQQSDSSQESFAKLGSVDDSCCSNTQCTIDPCNCAQSTQWDQNYKDARQKEAKMGRYAKNSSSDPHTAPIRPNPHLLVDEISGVPILPTDCCTTETGGCCDLSSGGCCSDSNSNGCCAGFGERNETHDNTSNATAVKQAKKIIAREAFPELLPTKTNASYHAWGAFKEERVGEKYGGVHFVIHHSRDNYDDLTENSHFVDPEGDLLNSRQGGDDEDDDFQHQNKRRNNNNNNVNARNNNLSTSTALIDPLSHKKSTSSKTSTSAPIHQQPAQQSVQNLLALNNQIPFYNQTDMFFKRIKAQNPALDIPSIRTHILYPSLFPQATSSNHPLQNLPLLTHLPGSNPSTSSSPQHSLFTEVPAYLQFTINPLALSSIPLHFLPRPPFCGKQNWLYGEYPLSMLNFQPLDPGSDDRFYNVSLDENVKTSLKPTLFSTLQPGQETLKCLGKKCVIELEEDDERASKSSKTAPKADKKAQSAKKGVQKAEGPNGPKLTPLNPAYVQARAILEFVRLSAAKSTRAVNNPFHAFDNNSHYSKPCEEYRQQKAALCLEYKRAHGLLDGNDIEIEHCGSSSSSGGSSSDSDSGVETKDNSVNAKEHCELQPPHHHELKGMCTNPFALRPDDEMYELLTKAKETSEFFRHKKLSLDSSEPPQPCSGPPHDIDNINIDGIPISSDQLTPNDCEKVFSYFTSTPFCVDCYELLRAYYSTVPLHQKDVDNNGVNLPLACICHIPKHLKRDWFLKEVYYPYYNKQPTEPNTATMGEVTAQMNANSHQTQTSTPTHSGLTKILNYTSNSNHQLNTIPYFSPFATGDTAFLSTPGIIPFSTLMALSTLYYRHKHTFEEFLEASQRIKCQSAGLGCKVLKSVFDANGNPVDLNAQPIRPTTRSGAAVQDAQNAQLQQEKDEQAKIINPCPLTRISAEGKAELLSSGLAADSAEQTPTTQTDQANNGTNAALTALGSSDTSTRLLFQQYIGLVTTQSFLWLLQVLKQPLVYNSTLIEFDEETNMSFFPKNQIPDAYLHQDIQPVANPYKNVIHTAPPPPPPPSLSQNSPLNLSSRTSHSLSESDEDYESDTDLSPTGSTSEEYDNYFEPPSDEVSKYYRTNLTTMLSNRLNDFLPPARAVQPGVLNTADTPGAKNKKSTQKSLYSTSNDFNAFPYEITRKNLPSYRALLYHFETLSPLHLLRLFRSSFNLTTLNPNEKVMVPPPTTTTASLGPLFDEVKIDPYRLISRPQQQQQHMINPVVVPQSPMPQTSSTMSSFHPTLMTPQHDDFYHNSQLFQSAIANTKITPLQYTPVEIKNSDPNLPSNMRFDQDGHFMTHEDHNFSAPNDNSGFNSTYATEPVRVMPITETLHQQYQIPSTTPHQILQPGSAKPIKGSRSLNKKGRGRKPLNFHLQNGSSFDDLPPWVREKLRLRLATEVYGWASNSPAIEGIDDESLRPYFYQWQQEHLAERQHQSSKKMTKKSVSDRVSKPKLSQHHRNDVDDDFDGGFDDYNDDYNTQSQSQQFPTPPTTTTTTTTTTPQFGHFYYNPLDVQPDTSALQPYIQSSTPFPPLFPTNLSTIAPSESTNIDFSDLNNSLFSAFNNNFNNQAPLSPQQQSHDFTPQTPTDFSLNLYNTQLRNAFRHGHDDDGDAFNMSPYQTHNNISNPQQQQQQQQPPATPIFSPLFSSSPPITSSAEVTSYANHTSSSFTSQLTSMAAMAAPLQQHVLRHHESIGNFHSADSARLYHHSITATQSIFNTDTPVNLFTPDQTTTRSAPLTIQPLQFALSQHEPDNNLSGSTSQPPFIEIPSFQAAEHSPVFEPLNEHFQ